MLNNVQYSVSANLLSRSGPATLGTLPLARRCRVPAYVIAEIEVADPEAYEPYKVMSSVAADRYGGRFVVRGGEVLPLEGSVAGRVVVIEFDDLEAARRWYYSPEYQEAVAVRQSASTGRLFAVQGLTAG
jgi:uncharacterized protein (DUF1330 family)